MFDKQALIIVSAICSGSAQLGTPIDADSR